MNSNVMDVYERCQSGSGGGGTGGGTSSLVAVEPVVAPAPDSVEVEAVQVLDPPVWTRWEAAVLAAADQAADTGAEQADTAAEQADTVVEQAVEAEIPFKTQSWRR